MNYEKIYINLCNLCKSLTVKERLARRNKNDERFLSDYIYTEKHHILPRHNGGNDSEPNLVEMLPEEHYIAHLIRYKAYNDRNDFLAIRFMVNGYMTKSKLKYEIPIRTKNKMIASFKQNISMFRKVHEWQTEEGRKRISESRKGMVPVKDSETGVLLGSVRKDHPDLLSGKWVHHSSGFISVIVKKTKEKKRISKEEYRLNKNLYKSNTGDMEGKNNPTYSGFTDEELVKIVVDFSKEMNMGILFPWRMAFSYYRKKEGYEKLPKSFSNCRFNGRGSKELHRIASEITGLPLKPYSGNNKKIKNELKNKK